MLQSSQIFIYIFKPNHFGFMNHQVIKFSEIDSTAYRANLQFTKSVVIYLFNSALEDKAAHKIRCSPNQYDQLYLFQL